MGPGDVTSSAAHEAPTTYTSSSAAPVAASAVFVVLFGAMFLMTLAGVAGLTPVRPPLWLSGGLALVFLALTILSTVVLVGSRGNRFTVDALGVRATSRDGGFDLPWSEIGAVRVVLLARRPVVPELLLPTPLDLRTSAHLELTLPRAAALEARQPILRRVRVRKPGVDCATHRIALASDRLISTAEPSDYSPDLQRVLSNVAGDALLPTEVRRAWTL